MVGAKIMKYYKDNAGNVSAFELDGSQDHLITDKMVKMTEAEEVAHRNPDKTIQEQITELEGSVTPRNYREYLKGIRDPGNADYKYSTDKIDRIDAEIETLRK